MRFYGICILDDSNIFLVMDYFQDGSLLEQVRMKKFSMADKVRFCSEIIHGIWHLHAQDVLHGDIALRNVLVDIHNMKAVISDFGQSCIITTSILTMNAAIHNSTFNILVNKVLYFSFSSHPNASFQFEARIHALYLATQFAPAGLLPN